jgi:hypothetical protein
MKGPTKDVINRILLARGWFWLDHYSGLAKKLRELEREGRAVRKFKNKHGIYYERPQNPK